MVCKTNDALCADINNCSTTDYTYISTDNNVLQAILTVHWS